MPLLYNIDFELAILGCLLVMSVFLRMQYSGNSEVSRRFRRLTFFVLLSDIMDVVTAVTISYASGVPAWANVLLNTIYFAMIAGVGYYFMIYVMVYIHIEEERSTLLKINRVVLFTYLIVLVGNLFGKGIFFFRPSGEYVHGFLYPLVYVIPLYYIVITLFIFLYNLGCFALKQKVSVVVFCILAILGPILQMTLFPDVLLGVYSVSLAVLIGLFSLETPDYQRLEKAMDKLEQSKNEAEAAKDIAETAEYAAEIAKGEAEEAGIIAYEASQVKSEFLKNMSHEVRTPINAILGYNEMIMKESEESQTVTYATNIQTAGQTLLSMMNNILDYVNIDAGNLKLEPECYKTLSMLKNMVTYGEYNAEKKNLEFRVFVDENIPCKLYGDMPRLIQIYINLVSNAIKFTQEGFVEFRIAWKPKNDHRGFLSVEVNDSGIGMTSDAIKKIGTSFARVDRKRTQNIQGVGLGLSIVTRLLELMDSELVIQSKYEEGSTFSFQAEQEIVDSTPIGKIDWSKSDMVALPSKSSVSFQAPGAKILIVDDSPINLDLFKGILKQTKIQIDTAINGEKALEYMEAGEYHVIFLDHMMPVMDGVETLHEMRRRKLCPGVPVIALTANAVSGARENYLKEGFDEYMSKPIVSKQLEDLIHRYLPSELVLEQMGDTEVVEDGTPEDLLGRLSFLDTDMGMSYCNASEELYKKILTSFRDNGRIESIRQYYREENWKEYRIQVHALKSTSRSIGAPKLAEQARVLERAAKDGDISYIRGHNDELLERYQILLGQLAGALSESEKGGMEKEKMESDAAHILVVDDDPINLCIAEQMLEQNYHVSCAVSGDEAMAFLQKDIPDLILLDIHMPGMNGFEVLESIKEEEKYAEIPVIFLTADEEREVEVRGFKVGALDFITKPFIADIMLQRVKRILELDRLQKNLQEEVRKQTKKAEDRRQKIERMSVQVMETLASTIDAKDKYTNGHSVRVAEYSREMMRRMGGSEQEQADVYYTGLLHDIGKIGIPDAIISKASGLTDEEYDLIKSHPVIGADILQNISEIPGIDVGARWHHEKYDGTGYPDGLKGEEIPEMARLIGVADAYDAMASKRSYRDVLPQEVVRGEIEKGRGTQFDPYFADIMLQMIDDDTDYKMREM